MCHLQEAIVISGTHTHTHYVYDAKLHLMEGLQMDGRGGGSLCLCVALASGSIDCIAITSSQKPRVSELPCCFAPRH